MELLHELNSFSSLSEFKKMSELNINEKYPVTEIKEINTKYGKKIIVLPECVVSLPKRCDEKASDYLKLNDIKPLYFVYLGSKDIGNAQPGNMFKLKKLK